MIEYRCPIGTRGITAMQRASLVILNLDDVQRGHHYSYAEFDPCQIEHLAGSVYIDGDMSCHYCYCNATEFRQARGVKEIYFNGFDVVFVGGGQAPFGVDSNIGINAVEYTLGVLGL